MDNHIWRKPADQFADGRLIGDVPLYIPNAGHRLFRLSTMDKSRDVPTSGGEATNDMPADKTARTRHKHMPRQWTHAGNSLITPAITSIASSNCDSVCDAI